jgi:spermidine synthase
LGNIDKEKLNLVIRPATYLLTGTVAAATIALELIQTRILSFLYFNHVVYLTITIALLGFGISGVLVSLLSSRVRNPGRVISLLAAAFFISSFLCLSLVSRVPVIFGHQPTAIKLIVSYFALVTPFLFSGALLGLIFMLHAASINRLYFCDLVSSGAAVVAFVALLGPLSGDWFLWLISGVIGLGFLVYSRGILSPIFRWGVVAAFLVILASVNGHLLGNQPEPYKMLGHAYDPGRTTAKVEATQWTPIGRIDVWSDSTRDMIDGHLDPTASNRKMITQDADAFTILTNPQSFGANPAQGEQGAGTSVKVHSLLHPNPAEVLVIGAGGGLDIISAKAYGAGKITGVEINPATVALDKGKYRDFAVWPKWDNVNLVRGEGRNFVRGRREQYDTIVMNAVDTFSALSSGAYVLSENYLYTSDAFRDYLTALKPNGSMSIWRWFFYQQPRESLRLAGIYLDAAERMGIAHPDQSIMVISKALTIAGERWAMTLVKKEPFTPDDVRKIEALTRQSPDLSLIYVPKVLPPDEQASLEGWMAANDPPANTARKAYNGLLTSHRGAERDAFFRNYPYRVSPVYDNRPFFFEYFRIDLTSWNGIRQLLNINDIRGPVSFFVLYATLAISILLCLACILAPLTIFQRRGLAYPGSIPLLLYFAALGFGYMTFEVGAMQILNIYIGDPAYSLSLVLAVLLMATGAGSAISARFSHIPARQVLTFAMVAIAAVISLWIVLTRIIHPLTMNLPLPGRAFIALLGLLPVGILLGLPFPSAVRYIEKRSPSFIPWAWGINGISSVIASMTAIILAMRIGFTAVIFVGAATYLLGLAAFWKHSRAAS